MKSKRQTESESNERAVSPVIGVILMVAITVILAAVIAAFVLDIGPGSAPVNANLDVSVDENTDDASTVDVRVDAMGDASEFELRGDTDAISSSGQDEIEDLEQTGDTASFELDEDVDDDENNPATISIVAIDGNNEQTAWEEEIEYGDGS